MGREDTTKSLVHDLLSEQLVEDYGERLDRKRNMRHIQVRKEQLTVEVVWTAAKLTASMRSARL